jgi:hypothetical protein
MIVPITMSIPSNNLELALWMESERLLHPIINQIGSTRRTGLSRKKRLSLRQPTLRKKPIVKENMFESPSIQLVYYWLYGTFRHRYFRRFQRFS